LRRETEGSAQGEAGPLERHLVQAYSDLLGKSRQRLCSFIIENNEGRQDRSVQRKKVPRLCPDSTSMGNGCLFKISSGRHPDGHLRLDAICFESDCRRTTVRVYRR
jgi:hypothetical protein